MEQQVIQKEAEHRERKANVTGIPTQMKLDFERRSGLSFDDVRVHYNSDKPAKIGALAYTQGNQVHVGPGQEKHLRHELGHVVQQMTGTVSTTDIIYNLPVNKSAYLEQEADSWKFSSLPLNLHELSPVVQFKKPDIRDIAYDDEGMCDEETVAEDVDDEDIDTDGLESPHLFEKDSRKRTKLLKQARWFRRRSERDESPKKILGGRGRRDPNLRLISLIGKEIAKAVIKQRFLKTLEQRLVNWISQEIGGSKSGITVCDSAEYIINTVQNFFEFLVKHRDNLSRDVQYANPWFLSAILDSLADMHIVKIQWPILLDYITSARSYYIKFKATFDAYDMSDSQIAGTSWLIFCDTVNVSKRIRPNWSNLKLNVRGVENKYGVKFVGIHYTSIESAVKLHGQHPCDLMIGKENGTARGKGFYFFPALRLPSKRDDSAFGEIPMAVFVLRENSAITYSKLSQDKIDNFEGIMQFPNNEAVIPICLFDKTIIMSCFGDIVDLSAFSSEDLAVSLYLPLQQPREKKRGKCSY